MDDAITLEVGNKRFEGWTEMSISRGIDAIAGSFELSVTDREPGKPDLWTIRAGEACRVLLGGDVVINGWIDSVAPSFSTDMHSIRVTGRDRAADLVDCSAVHKPGSWSGRKLEQIAADLVKPFGLTVTARTSTGAAFKTFALQQGESVWEAIGRLCKFRGLLMQATADGNVEIITPGTRRAPFKLVQGENILSGEAAHDVRDRFSQYILKGQSAGDDDANGKTTSQARAESADPAVKRYRPLLVVADEQADTASLKKRAGWEATVRAGRSQTVTLTAQGWRDPAGAIWSPDLVVPVTSSWLGIDGDLLLASLQYTLSAEEGSKTALTLMPREAFSLIPIPEKADASQVKGKSK